MLIGLGYFGLFLGCYLAATVIPLPSDAFLIGLWEQDYPTIPVVIIAIVASFLGAMTNYYIGRRCNTAALNRRFKLNDEKIRKWEQRFDKWGHWLGFISLAPFVGAPMIAVLGYFKARAMPLAITVFVSRILRYIFTALIYHAVI